MLAIVVPVDALAVVFGHARTLCQPHQYFGAEAHAVGIAQLLGLAEPYRLTGVGAQLTYEDVYPIVENSGGSSRGVCCPTGCIYSPARNLHEEDRLS